MEAADRAALKWLKARPRLRLFMIILIIAVASLPFLMFLRLLFTAMWAFS